MLKSLISIPIRIVLKVLYPVFLIGYGVALLAPKVSPVVSEIPAYFNLAFGLFYLGAVFYLVYFLVHWKDSSLFLVFHLLLIAFTADYLTTYSPMNVFEGLKEKRDLRVMTYNVENFYHRLSEDTAPYAVGIIKKYDPDIVCLQESVGGTSDSRSEAWFREYFTKDEYPFVVASARKRLTLLSKYPVKEHHIVEYESYTNGSESYLIEVSGKKLLLINNHLESYSLSDVEKEKYRGFFKTSEVKRMWAHFKEVKERLSPNMLLRVSATQATHRDMVYSQSEHKPDYTIVLGDFNDTPMSYAYSKLRGDMKDAYQQVGFGPGISYNEDLLPFRIDHVLYSGSLDAIGGKIPWIKEASDHNPVIIDFTLG